MVDPLTCWQCGSHQFVLRACIAADITVDSVTAEVVDAVPYMSDLNPIRADPDCYGPECAMCGARYTDAPGGHDELWSIAQKQELMLWRRVDPYHDERGET